MPRGFHLKFTITGGGIRNVLALYYTFLIVNPEFNPMHAKIDALVRSVIICFVFYYRSINCSFLNDATIVEIILFVIDSSQW